MIWHGTPAGGGGRAATQHAPALHARCKPHATRDYIHAYLRVQNTTRKVVYMYISLSVTFIAFLEISRGPCDCKTFAVVAVVAVLAAATAMIVLAPPDSRLVIHHTTLKGCFWPLFSPTHTQTYTLTCW